MSYNQRSFIGNVILRWADLKSVLMTKDLSLQYVDGIEKYQIFTFDGPIAYQCELFKAGYSNVAYDPDYSQTENDIDRVDFETNFQASANQVIGLTSRSVVGSITSNGGTAEVVIQGSGDLGIQITGTWTGTLQFEATIDGTTWFAKDAEPVDNSIGVTSTITNGAWRVTSGGFNTFRTRASAFSGGGTATIHYEVSVGSSLTKVSQGAPNVVANAWPIEITDGTSVVGVSTVGSVKALKVDVVQTVGSVGSGGTSSSFGAVFPPAGTAAGFTDGYDMQGAQVFDLDTSAGVQNVLGVNLRGSASGGSVEIGTSTHPVRTDPTGTTTQPVSGTLTTTPGTQVANIDAGNSSTSPLGGSATFTGTGIDVSGYGVIIVFVFADQAGTLNLEFSIDNSHWDNVLPYDISASKSEHVQIGPQAQYFRVVYANGSSAQGTFRLQTIEKPITAFHPVVPVDTPVDKEGDALLTKSVISGRMATTADVGTYVDVQVNTAGSLATYIGDSSSATAFGSLRVASPLSLFSNKQIFSSQPLYWDDQQTSGGGTSSTFLTNKAATQMTVTGNVAGTRVRQSFRRMNYEPGKGQLVFITGVLVNEGGSGNAAVNRRLGLFDGNNGYFFELTGTTMNVALRTSSSGSAVTTYVAQSSWNIDKMDGTGSSGITFNPAQAQIFVIDFQWLGTGRIRYGFDINGIIYYAHQILIANNQNVVSISNPNLPLRYEIQSLGTGSASSFSMQHICGTVISEGGQEDIGFTFGVDTAATPLVTGNNANVYTLIALQLQSTMLSASIEPTFFTVTSVTANAQFRVALILNPTIAGSALSYNAVTNSALQFALGAAANTVSGGTTIYSGYFQTNKAGSITDKLTIDIGLGSSIAGVSDTLVLAVQPTPALAISLLGSLNWKETI